MGLLIIVIEPVTIIVVIQPLAPKLHLRLAAEPATAAILTALSLLFP